MKEIARIEPRLAKTTGYHVKLVERLGRPLPILFSKNLSGPKYHRAECAPCANPHTKGPSFCNLKSVVYEVVCALCDKEHKESVSTKHKGRYVGQSSRTLFERASEHLQGLSRFDPANFLFKHWAVAQVNFTPPRVPFSGS